MPYPDLCDLPCGDSEPGVFYSHAQKLLIRQIVLRIHSEGREIFRDIGWTRTMFGCPGRLEPWPWDNINRPSDLLYGFITVVFMQIIVDQYFLWEPFSFANEKPLPVTVKGLPG